MSSSGKNTARRGRTTSQPTKSSMSKLSAETEATNEEDENPQPESVDCDENESGDVEMDDFQVVDEAEEGDAEQQKDSNTDDFEFGEVLDEVGASGGEEEEGIESEIALADVDIEIPPEVQKSSKGNASDQSATEKDSNEMQTEEETKEMESENIEKKDQDQVESVNEKPDKTEPKENKEDKVEETKYDSDFENDVDTVYVPYVKIPEAFDGVAFNRCKH